MVVPVDRANLYGEYRPLLFSLAYRMLGTSSDAEDAVQDVFLRLEEHPPGDKAYMKAYLCKMTVNRCLDLLKRLRLQRELYIGPWLPEPVSTEADDPSAAYLRGEGISFAILLLLETLDPAERAVYILREAFAFDYKAIAEATGRSEAACRQTMSRLRPKIEAAQPPGELMSADEAAPLVLQFLHAARTGDLAGMLELLHRDAVLRSDGGGKVSAAVRPIAGAQAVAAFLGGLARKFAGAPDSAGRPGEAEAARVSAASEQPASPDGPASAPAAAFGWLSLNDQPGLLFRIDGQVDTALVIEASAGRIRALYLMRNPEKLHGLRGGGS
ncbi:sigma-70 family RNA polymerase sigma factor [Saccharibacillus brassicae]|uniref:Sigma-70 family RNA polymerase sigma factor n=1 Tax=Saccharibacillus brassicae TaxID=2583377 RepID=A0A4Y6UZU5_SACBS|nr:sigma-70 family RNA polymerase sigma factor [Saccharibacillus brassicae]QDH22110.1 sigma-70 family RNA polymerase sigma factor [Saccharibacillus brassicae]